MQVLSARQSLGNGNAYGHDGLEDLIHCDWTFGCYPSLQNLVEHNDRLDHHVYNLEDLKLNLKASGIHLP